MLTKSNSDVKGLSEDHLGKLAYYIMVKQQAPEVYGNLLNLINDEFVNQLRKDVEITIRNLSQSSKGQTVARSRVLKPTLDVDFPAFGPRAPPPKASQTVFVPPPKPILPIADQPRSPPQKRDATKIEGIEDLEVSPRSKARAKAATTKVEADDPRAFTLAVTAMVQTVVKAFTQYAMKSIQSHNIDLLDDYIKIPVEKKERYRTN